MNINKYTSIMIFYFILSYIIGPAIGYYSLGRTTCAAGHGFVVGSIISIVLWYTVGYKMAMGK
jgi:hypothetical protein